MSLKHHKRTRAEILAKREAAIPARRANKFVATLKPVPPQGPTSRSKYKPHIGAKEELRAQDRAYMEEAFPTARGMRGTQPIGIAYHRSAPILCQARRGQIVRAPY